MADGAASPDRVDRLGALNDELLHEIITRLPVIGAASTAILARRWRHLWSSSPLVLDDADLPEPARDAVVPQILRGHGGRFLSVRLTDCRLASLDRELPGWPRLLADKRTEELLLANGLSFSSDPPDDFPRLPADILRCGWLQKLTLGFWELPVDLSRGAGISLPRLRELDLFMTVTSEQDLEDLISACPVLKVLKLTPGDENRPRHIRLRSQSLQCALVGLCGVEEFTVVNAPLLERLVLFAPGSRGVRVEIGSAAKLKVLGDLDTRAHRLQIGDNAIELNTMASTSTVIPSVKILAVTVNFGVLWEVKMLASFLRCFPNIDTLHIKSFRHDPSVTASEPSGEHHARFWQQVSPVECLRSHVKKMVIHKFRGDQNEFEFLKFIAMNAQELQSLPVLLLEENIYSTDVVDEIEDKLQSLGFRPGMSGELLVLRKGAFTESLQKATNLAFNDPFLFWMHG